MTVAETLADAAGEALRDRQGAAWDGRPHREEDKGGESARRAVRLAHGDPAAARRLSVLPDGDQRRGGSRSSATR